MNPRKIEKSVQIGVRVAVENVSVWSLARVELFPESTASVIPIPVQRETMDYLAGVLNTVYRSVTELVSVNQAGKWTLQGRVTVHLMSPPATLQIN